MLILKCNNNMHYTVYTTRIHYSCTVVCCIHTVVPITLLGASRALVVLRTMYTVYNVQCTVYSVRCVYCLLYTVHIVYSIYYSM